MRRNVYIGQAPQQAVFRQWFAGKNVQHGTTNATLLQGHDQVIFIDDISPADIDQHRRWFHHSEYIGVDIIPGPGCVRQGKHDVVQPGEEFSKFIRGKDFLNCPAIFA